MTATEFTFRPTGALSTSRSHMMTAKDILREKGSYVAAIGPEARLTEAISELVDRKIGSLVVVEPDGKLVGIITERDVLMTCNRVPDRLRDIQVKDVMTRQIIVADPDEDIDHIKAVMTHNRIRHLPIVSGQHLEGLVSIGDVVKILHEEAEKENSELKDYISGKYI